MFKSLKNLKSIEFVDLGNIKMTGASLDALVSSLTQVLQLKHLDIRKNAIDINRLKNLSSVLIHLKQLKFISVASTDMNKKNASIFVNHSKH